jgi:hypothetical protein
MIYCVNISLQLIRRLFRALCIKTAAYNHKHYCSSELPFSWVNERKAAEASLGSNDYRYLNNIMFSANYLSKEL